MDRQNPPAPDEHPDSITIRSKHAGHCHNCGGKVVAEMVMVRGMVARGGEIDARLLTGTAIRASELVA